MERIRPNSQFNNNSRNGRNSEDNEKTSIWTAIFDYEASGEDELTLNRGDRVEVLSMDTKISGDEGKYRFLNISSAHFQSIHYLSQ
jgi:hypothetical protein